MSKKRKVTEEEKQQLIDFEKSRNPEARITVFDDTDHMGRPIVIRELPDDKPPSDKA